jgi:hypothetical protein
VEFYSRDESVREFYEITGMTAARGSRNGNGIAAPRGRSMAGSWPLHCTTALESTIIGEVTTGSHTWQETRFWRLGINGIFSPDSRANSQVPYFRYGGGVTAPRPPVERWRSGAGRCDATCRLYSPAGDDLGRAVPSTCPRPTSAPQAA